MGERSQKKKTSAKAWSGRFSEGPDPLVEAFANSIPFDVRLLPYDLQGSLAHVKMLARQGIVTTQEARRITAGLLAIQKEWEGGKLTFPLEDEDVHMFVEKRLAEKIGPTAGKLHTARSRNDQVALDLRLYLRDHLQVLKKELLALQRRLLQTAKVHGELILPGYTHLQRAQPVLLGHHLLAYLEMFCRDQERLSEIGKRVNCLPLGSAALAGTSFPIDRRFLARELGFETVAANSMDAVSDRDFVVEFLAAASILMMHYSRMAEELILWSTSEFDFIEIGDAFCTGSSIMPQKKKSGCTGIDPRKDRQGLWPPPGPVDHFEGPSLNLQQRLAGRQRAPVRYSRHDYGLHPHPLRTLGPGPLQRGGHAPGR